MLGLSAPETGRVRPATGLSYIYICNSICGVSYIHMHVCIWLHKYVGMHMYKGSGHMSMSGKTICRRLRVGWFHLLFKEIC